MDSYWDDEREMSAVKDNIVELFYDCTGHSELSLKLARALLRLAEGDEE